MAARGPTAGTLYSTLSTGTKPPGEPSGLCLHHRLDARPHSVPLSHHCCNEAAEVGQRVSAGRTSPPPHLLWASPIPPSLGFHGSVWQRGVYFKMLAGMPGRSHRDTGLGVRGGSSHLLSAYSERVLSKTSHIHRLPYSSSQLGEEPTIISFYR